jgi:NTP pyrophosphatase (non-canonical NTP hydrolase)
MGGNTERDIFRDIVAITQWLDKASGTIPGDDAMRVMKLSEEVGEVVSAYIGMTGQNPRKGITHTQADLCLELADVAITAMCAIAHFTRQGYGTYNPNVTRAILASKVADIIKRSDIPPLIERS